MQLAHRHFQLVYKILCTLFVVAFFLIALPAQAADIGLSPSTGFYSRGQTFTINIRAVPNGDNIKAAESKLTFNQSVLNVVNVSKGPAFSIWTNEPAFSNSAGTITFGGRSPSPFTSPSNILTVTFRAVAEGTGTVGFSNTSILAADDPGTEVFANAQTGLYAVSIPTTTPAPAATEKKSNDSEEAIISRDSPRPPVISSQIFLDQNAWYSDTNSLFTWTLPLDVDAVAIEIADSDNNRPEENEDSIIDPPVEEFAVTSDLVSDGVQFMSINYHNQLGWGTPTNRRLQIDTTAPEPFVVNVTPANEQRSFPLLNFEANDKTSGIDYYKITVADQEPIRIAPDEARMGYLLGELEDGTYTVKVVAFDMAENGRESSAAVWITAGWVKPDKDGESPLLFDYITFSNLLIFFLIVTIVLLVVYIWYGSRLKHEREERLRKETREIQDQMEKIFSALRDEIYDQILHITKRKRLSTKEKEAIEGLTQALEVSETLIEKEINDVKTILK